MSTLGTCGRCGGRVSVPDLWYGVNAPTPTCEGCGAVPKNAYGPVIPMEGAPTPRGPSELRPAIGTWLDGQSVNAVAQRLNGGGSGC